MKTREHLKRVLNAQVNDDRSKIPKPHLATLVAQGFVYLLSIASRTECDMLFVISRLRSREMISTLSAVLGPHSQP